MKEHRLEVADVFRQYGKKFLSRWAHTLSPQQRKALRDIGICRTAALGGHVEECDHCSNRLTVFNSCRNRNCPKCHARARDLWLAKQAEQILPVPYCHVIFTVPDDDLAPLALQNQRLFYTLLFRAAAETLLTIAADPKRLGARIGFLAVLHTWSQQLLPHPHLHCLVPAGGIAKDGSKWIPCRPKFFLPVQVLSAMFRGKLLDFLKKAYAEGKLRFSGKQKELTDPMRFKFFLDDLRKKKWGVHARPPLDSQHVLKYLARYTHRVAISNGRLVSLANDQVSFRWRNSKNGNRIDTMKLDAVEFMRRFLLHVLPPGFVKIRHFGFLSNRNHSRELVLCRQCLNPADRSCSIEFNDEQQRAMKHRCPFCRKGTLHIIAWLSEQDLLIHGNNCVALYSMDSS